MKFSVIGSKVDTSLSPLLHSWIYKKLKLDHAYGYIKLSKDSVDNMVDEIKKRKLNGANITMPFKESILKDIDGLDDISKKIGLPTGMHVVDADEEKLHGGKLRVLLWKLIQTRHIRLIPNKRWAPIKLITVLIGDQI